MTDYIHVLCHFYENQLMIYNPIHIHKRHFLSRLRIRSKIKENYCFLNNANQIIDKKYEDELKIEDALQENNTINIDVSLNSSEKYVFINIKHFNLTIYKRELIFALAALVYMK